MKSLVCSVCVLVLSSVAVGCGGSTKSVGPTGPLSGQITVGGTPVPAGCTLVAQHLESGATASAITKEGGEYQFPRLRVGEHAIGIISAIEEKGEVNPDLTMDQIDAGDYEEGEEMVAIPLDYQAPETSPLKASVTEEGATADFAI